jgi:hypothetical protein
MGRFRFSSGTAISLLLALLPAIASSPHPSQKGTETAKQVKENALAGLRPGRDIAEKAYQRFGKEPLSTDTGSVSWGNECNRQELTLALDSSGVIQSVTVGPVVGVVIDADCELKAYSREVRAKLGSGRGLLLRDRCDRIQRIYGTPQSESSSENRNERFESYLYRFDWEGKRVPLTLEVTCNASEDQVYRIKLAVARG